MKERSLSAGRSGEVLNSDVKALKAAGIRALAAKAEVIEALEEALELLNLCDPNGSRVAAFGNRVAEDPAVRELCERHGYGAVMDSAARQWRLKTESGVLGYSGSSHTTGPAVASVQRGVKMLRSALRRARRL